MTVLSSKRVLEDKQTRNPEAITALALTHKALADVSCLSEFTNLERLDVSVNNLTSLEGLRSCVNLKWLSVVQNKLQSLKGIGGLTKLTVLNAGKNNLKSMDDVRSLISLRALILNDNEIVTICRLDQMKELNTLVLSRNPISKIGESLGMVKSITKASLSNCHLESIDSLKSCTELKELRLAHNDIKTLPSELIHNTKLQLLDVGNNSITSWSDLKVLSGLINLRNLNLQGNPIAEKDKLAKKIRKLVPNLQIFNSKPIDQKDAQKEGKIEQNATIDQHDTATDVVIDLSSRQKYQKTRGLAKEGEPYSKENDTVTDNKLKKKPKKVQENEDNKETEFTNPFAESQLKHKKDKTSQILNAEEDGTETGKDLKWKSKRAKLNEANVIDDGETPFADLFAITGENTENSGVRYDEKVVQDVNAINGLNTFPVKSKKIKSRAKSSALQLSPTVEVGLGGPSMWDDE